jgi:hypothetical protein
LSRAIEDIFSALQRNWYRYDTPSLKVAYRFYYVKILQPRRSEWRGEEYFSFRAVRYTIWRGTWLVLSFNTFDSLGKWERVPERDPIIKKLDKEFTKWMLRDGT